MDEISNFMECHNLQVCTIAEADINVASAPGYIRAWKLRGFQAALSAPDPSGLCRVALISRVNFRVFQISKGFAQHRCAAGLFDLLCDEEVCQFVIASFYGQSGNAPAAAAQADDILAACNHSNLPYIVVGDFNLEPIGFNPMKPSLEKPGPQEPSSHLTMCLGGPRCPPQAQDVNEESIMDYAIGRLLPVRCCILTRLFLITPRSVTKSRSMSLRFMSGQDDAPLAMTLRRTLLQSLLNLIVHHSVRP